MKNTGKNTKTFSIVVAVLAVLVFMVFSVGGATLSATGNAAESGNTSALYTKDILNKAGITLSADDEVIRQDSDGAVSLTIIRAFDVKIVYRGEIFTVSCTGGTVAEAIASAGITLSGAETVTSDLNTEVKEGDSIVILAPSIISFTADGETHEVATKAQTVAEFLAELSVEVGEDDILSTSIDAEITEGMSITLKRVEYKEEVKTEIIDYGFISEETDDLYLGTTKIERYGIEGEREITYKCKYIDGELAEEEVIDEKIIKEPVDQLELVGTYEEPVYEEPEPPVISNPSLGGAGTFTDLNGNTVSYSKVLTGSATAYYANEGSHTATGTPVYKGGVAVNPNIIPYGTKMYIVSSDGSMVYGYATAVDTGGALMSGEALVDVFYPTYDECVNWGRRNVTVYILG